MDDQLSKQKQCIQSALIRSKSWLMKRPNARHEFNSERFFHNLQFSNLLPIKPKFGMSMLW